LHHYFKKIVAKKNSSSSSIPSNDAIDHDGDIIDSRTNEKKCGQQWHTYSIFNVTIATAGL
jgi:hypothetical protein